MPILERETTLFPGNLLETVIDQPQQRQWWAVYTKARQEKAFARQLVGMDVPFYLPLVRKNNLVRGKRVQSHIPLFLGYVFLFADDDERIRSLTTNRVSQVLTVRDQQQLSSELRQIAHLIEHDAPLTLESRLVPGDPVRVRKGPLAGVEGMVVCRRGRTRLLVAVTMLQQGVSIEIDDYLLEPL